MASDQLSNTGVDQRQRCERERTTLARANPDRRFRITERDLELLRFVATHRFVLACQVTEWLESSEVVAYRRLRVLLELGLVSYRRIFHARPGCYLVSPAGLAVLESELPRAAVDLRTYRHDIGLVWAWLAASNGCFGPCERVLSERQMRAAEVDGGGDREWYAIPLGGYGSGGRERVHYPDVLLIRADGARLAIELELTLKSRSRLEAILSGYAHERRIAGIVYFTDRPAIRAAVNETGLRVGLDARLEVEYFEPAPERDLERAWEHLTGSQSEGS